MTEIEAKFLIRHTEQIADVIAVLEDLDFIVERDATRAQVDTYFDTRDWAVLRAGWAYRCRQAGGSSSLMLKSTGEQDGAVFIRDEIVQPLPDTTPSSRGESPPGPVTDRLSEITGDTRTHKLFSVRTKRTVFYARRSGERAAMIELDLDETLIRAHKRRRDVPGRLEFTELEIELDTGEPITVAEIAATLREQLGLLPAQLSKFERGMLAAGLTPRLDGGDPPSRRLKAKDPVLELLFRFLRSEFAILVAQQPVAWEGLDPEGVHKMRVATRRVRALLRAFSSILAAEPAALIEPELRWLARQLGKARDADVCEAQIAVLNSALPADMVEAAAPYADHLRAETAGAYANLATVFDSDRYAALMAQFGAFAENGPTPKTLKAFGKISIADGATQLIGHTLQKTIKRGDRIRQESSARKLHKLRIIAKRLRYLLEFFATVQTRKWRKPIHALQELHDILGTHQDAVTAHALLADYARDIPAAEATTDLRHAIEALMEFEKQRIAECRGQFPQAWDRFRATVS